MYYVLLVDGLYKDARKVIEPLRESEDPCIRSVECLFEVKERLSETGEDKQTVRNVRNALAHSKIHLNPERSSLSYCGGEKDCDWIERPLVEVTLLGEMLWRYSVSVLNGARIL